MKINLSPIVFRANERFSRNTNNQQGQGLSLQQSNNNSNAPLLKANNQISSVPGYDYRTGALPKSSSDLPQYQNQFESVYNYRTEPLPKLPLITQQNQKQNQYQYQYEQVCNRTTKPLPNLPLITQQHQNQPESMHNRTTEPLPDLSSKEIIVVAQRQKYNNACISLPFPAESIVSATVKIKNSILDELLPPCSSDAERINLKDMESLMQKSGYKKE
ncbi:hypothetical protein IJG72_07640 [bacterium]|nr:hypothetical protein [bacterium]